MATPRGTDRGSALTVFSWNTQRTMRNAAQANALSHTLLECKVDVVALQETNLKTRLQFSLPGYTVYRYDRPAVGGGVALAIKDDIAQTPVDLLAIPGLEAVAATIHVGSRTLLVMSCYGPRQWEAEDLGLLRLHNRVLLLGDWNAKHAAWHNRSSNGNGRRLYRYLLDPHCLWQLNAPDTFTRKGVGGCEPSIIDFALTSGDIRFRTLATVPCTEHVLESDHLPVLGTLSLTLPPRRDAHTVSRETDWEKFRDLVETRISTEFDYSALQTDPSPRTLEQAVAQLGDVITTCGEASTSVRRSPITPPDISEETKELIKERRRSLRRFQQYRDPSDKSYVNLLSRQIRGRLMESRNDRWSTAIDAANVHDSKMWGMSKALGRRGLGTNRPIRGADGELVWTCQEKAETFASALEAQFCPAPLVARPPAAAPDGDSGESEWEEAADGGVAVQEAVESHLTAAPLTSARPATRKELDAVLGGLNPKKATGPDKITPLQIKWLGDSARAALLLLFNACLAACYFPAQWRVATVALIPKPGKCHSSPDGYRPISLLSALGKVYERIVQARLLMEVRSKQLLRDEQFGFRVGHSAPQQLLRLVTAVGRALDERRTLPTVFLDMRAAFDSVWHVGLLHCLIGKGVADCYVRLVASFLEERRFKVRHQGVLSSERKAGAGVPQGSCLSPLLFGLYVDDAPLARHCQLLMFADDFAYYAESANREKAVAYLNRTCRLLPRWLNVKRLSLNLNKCVAVEFGRKLGNPGERLPHRGWVGRVARNRERLAPTQVAIGRTRLPWSRRVKYLGVTLARGLSWRPHIENLRGKMFAKYQILRPLLRSRDLHLSKKRRLLTACIRPVATYACEVFAGAPKTILGRLASAESKIVRSALRPPPRTRNVDMYSRLGVSRTLPDEIQRRASVALERALGPKAPPGLRHLRRDLKRVVRGDSGLVYGFKFLPPLLEELLSQE